MTTIAMPPPNAPVAPALDETTYIVLEDFGSLGLAYRETDPEHADLESVLAGFIAGEFDRPIRVIAVNTAGGWVRDASRDIATQVRARSQRKGSRLSAGVRDFIEQGE